MRIILKFVLEWFRNEIKWMNINKTIIYIFIILTAISCKNNNVELDYYNQNIELVHNIRLDSNLLCTNIIINGKDLELGSDTLTLKINLDLQDPSIKIEHYPEFISYFGYILNPLIMIDSYCDDTSYPVKRRIYNSNGNLVYYKFSSKYVAIEEKGNLDSILIIYEVSKDEYSQNKNQINIKEYLDDAINN